MKKLGRGILSFLFILIVSTSVSFANVNYVPGELVVKFKDSFSRSDVFAVQESGFSFLTSSMDNEVHLLESLSRRTMLENIDYLMSTGRFEYVVPNYIFEMFDEPNDPKFDELWGLENTGKTLKITVGGQVREFPGKVGADISAIDAWQTLLDNNVALNNDVIVAVIDTGVFYTHEDLAANMWTNPGEIPNNQKDDDGNGYVDDIHGWDFGGSGDNDPTDAHMHGTHVSGIIGAVGNNGKGVVGVASNLKIMATKFLGDNGQGTLMAAVDAIKYAVNNGAKVINASWGAGQSAKPLEDAVNEAISKGVLFVAAAGNGGQDGKSDDNDKTPMYPSNYKNPGVLSVAATTNSDTLTFFSNYGKTTVDISAPGLGILSTIPKSSKFGNAWYGQASGTSMATPYVAGLAALILSIDSSLTNHQVKSIIMTTGDSVDGLNIASDRRINANAAVDLVLNKKLYIVPNHAVVKPSETHSFKSFGGDSSVTWSVSDSAVASISNDGVLTASAEGSVVVKATDGNGQVAKTSIITITNSSGGGGNGECPDGFESMPLPIGDKVINVCVSDDPNATCPDGYFPLPGMGGGTMCVPLDGLIPSEI